MNDITALLMKEQRCAEMAEKVMKRLREELERKSLKLSVSASGKEGKSKIIASCGFLVEGLRQCSIEEGVAW